MKSIVATAALVFAIVGGAFAQPPAKPTASQGSGGAAQAVMDLEQQWVKAAKANDADAISKLLAEDVVMLDSDGTMPTRTQVLERVKKAKWDTNEISDVKVTVHGDTAIATGRWTGKGSDGTGKSVDTKERWADTWVKRNGKWQCIASASATEKM